MNILKLLLKGMSKILLLLFLYYDISATNITNPWNTENKFQ